MWCQTASSLQTVIIILISKSGYQWPVFFYKSIDSRAKVMYYLLR